MDEVAFLPIPEQPGIKTAGELVLAARKREHPSGIVYRDAIISRAKPFTWAWVGRVLVANINLLVGVEGIGKGNLIAWLLARITKGELPGDLLGTPGLVAIVGDEDDFDQVWVPRIHAAGGDLKRVKYIEAGKHGTIDVRKDAPAIGEFAEELGVVVLYFDQLLDNIGIKTDDWRTKDVRDALAPLRRMVRDKNVAALGALHPNKRNSSNFRDIISGSFSFNALSRSSLLVGEHPDDESRRVVVRPKGNYAGEPSAFEFRIEGESFVLGRNSSRRTIQTSRICDIRETSLTKNDILQKSRKRPDSQMGLARAFLSRTFEDGLPRFAEEIEDAGVKLGLSWKTLTAAATELNFDKAKESKFQGRWFWIPPDADPEEVARFRR